MNTVFPKLIIEERPPKSKRIITKTREELCWLKAFLRELANPSVDGKYFESMFEISGKKAQG